jgi:ferredoxin
VQNDNVSIDQELCILCGTCVEVCPRGIVELEEDSARIKNPTRCMQCGTVKACALKTHRS